MVEQLAPVLTPTDAAVIARSLGDPERFREIFERHHRPVWRFLAARLGATLADDVCADTFATAFAVRDRYDTTRPDARPWLFGIAVNHAHRHRRRERLLLERRAAAERPTSSASLPLDPRSALARALVRLDARDREPLLLRALADLSHAEIAEALGVPEGTIRSRLNRARRQLKEAMDE